MSPRLQGATRSESAFGVNSKVEGGSMRARLRKSIRGVFVIAAVLTLLSSRGVHANVAWGGNGFTYWSEPGDCAGNGQGFRNLCESYCSSTWGFEAYCSEYSCAQWGDYCIQGYCDCFD
jgi:hypothetical protein